MADNTTPDDFFRKHGEEIVYTPAAPHNAPKTGYNADELQNMEFPPIKYIVEGYIPEGLTIFAGRPKIGKSWACLDIGRAVASGGKAFGSVPCEQGDVLYLALEDNPRRLKSRMEKISAYPNEWPPALRFETQWPRLNEGGVEKIRQWIESNPKARLVIIDTLGKVRGEQNATDSAYLADYKVLAELQALASEKGLAIIIVHHVRKMEADDPIDTVSGTLGLTGAADTILVLNRKAEGVTLYGRGRDIEEIETVLKFNKATCTWYIADGIYRPYFKQKIYFDRKFNERVYQIPKLFPTPEYKNIVISITGKGNLGFSALIANVIPDLCFTKTGNGGAQVFPLYYYEENEKQNKSLFDEGDGEYIRRDGVTDFILERAKAMYGKNVSKEDIFYYVYGFLHSPDYRETFANDLKKMLPRLPLVEDVRDFWKFSKAGRALAELHINYETVPAYESVKVTGVDSKFFTVEKMRFPKKDQKDTIHFNSKITITGIPAKAYEYLVNGKSAIEWIMERYAFTTHKESGIANNPNDWAEEVGNPRYILDLLLSIINVSVQTVDIVASLPKLSFEENSEKQKVS